MKIEPIEGYDSLKELRKIRDEISAGLEGLSPEEAVAYMQSLPGIPQEINSKEDVVPQEREPVLV